ncbi:hypothetical protein PhCBS80983_g01560 [Powellomyces hirtus]|uniref:RING-type domain-containing protein n=1 Tax=Powellomyces hirtus TaxID=109895 RepID=A0A507EAC8_9FUNG|nr:hypothetical protein PhCBS80983_g01560 [Powellomyces hirtus]
MPAGSSAVVPFLPTVPQTPTHTRHEDDDDNDKNNHNCAICRSTFKEAYVTACGHSFCYECITMYLHSSASGAIPCPVCQTIITDSHISPNFRLNTLIERTAHRAEQYMEADVTSELSLQDVDRMLRQLNKRKQQMESLETEASLHLMHEFLASTRSSVQKALQELTAQLAVLDKDMVKVEAQMSSLQCALIVSPHLQRGRTAAGERGKNLKEAPKRGTKRLLDRMPRDSQEVSTSLNITENETEPQPRTALSAAKPVKLLSTSILVQKRSARITEHVSELRDVYFKERVMANTADNDTLGDAYLSSFATSLSRLSRYSRLRTVATLDYAHGLYHTGSCIVSSIDFDKDDQFFATAGVTKKIKIFDYQSVLADLRQDVFSNPRVRAAPSPGRNRSERDDDTVPNHDSDAENSEEDNEAEGSGDDVPRFPILEIDSLAWNPHIKSHLVSADYEGIVNLWDSGTGAPISSFNEHEKRVWSVDWSSVDPTRFASGSDDAKGKIWSVNQKDAVATIHSTVNLCSVKWNPTHQHHVAFGSADHHIHYYDTRNLSAPLHIFQGHKKAVSYVRFADRNTLISCSTDSTLRMWDVDASISCDKSVCVRTFAGHTNAKNFVGMSIDSTSEFIACGSETDQVHVYWTGLSRPVVVANMGRTRDAVTGLFAPPRRVDEAPAPGGPFLSSVCWQRTQPGRLIAANSNGKVAVMELV